MKNSTPTSYVYAIRAIGTNRIKIGVALNPKQRLRELQTGCPFPLEIIHFWPGDYLLEAAIHNCLRPFRVAGEWFQISEWRLGWHVIETIRKRRRQIKRAAAEQASIPEWKVEWKTTSKNRRPLVRRLYRKVGARSVPVTRAEVERGEVQIIGPLNVTLMNLTPEVAEQWERKGKDAIKRIVQRLIDQHLRRRA